MKGYDAFAGVIKSGGKTRRAAKMVILNVDHPDITNFITCKAEEEKKAWALIEQGYDESIVRRVVRLVDLAPPDTPTDTTAFFGVLPTDADRFSFGRGV